MKKRLVRIGVALLGALLIIGAAACLPNDMGKAQKRLEKAGYTVTEVPTAELGESAMGALFAYQGDERQPTEWITVLLLESEEAAKAFFELHAEDMKHDETATAKVKKKWIVVGSEKAVKDFLH